MVIRRNPVSLRCRGFGRPARYRYPIRHDGAATLYQAVPVRALFDMVVITRLTHRISIRQPSYLVGMSLVRYTDKPVSLISYPVPGMPTANRSFHARAASGFSS